ncbi:MAG: cell wall hydrolase [Alphaproteobacteria bacterium]|nr:cell wall hydrolase [Alphaproteobacteria bacterium]
MKFSERDVDILARTIYGEARGELFKHGIASLIAIANVVFNRLKKNFAPTVAEVCIAPYQFSCWNEHDINYKKIKEVTTECSVFRTCREVAANVLAEKWPDLTDGCDHYHNKAIKPAWTMYLEPKRVFGSHYFYNLRD